MHLYEVNPVDQMPVHVVARSAQEAVDLFVTWSAARGRLQPAFDMDEMSVENLQPEQQAGPQGIRGRSHWHRAFRRGDRLDLHATDVAAISSRRACKRRRELGVFQMREPSVPLEAFVLASDQEGAAALLSSVRAHDGDPDTLLWRREWPADQLDEPERSVIEQVLTLRREGLLTPDVLGRWAFITPTGDH